MRNDLVSEVSIDGSGRLHVRSASQAFPHIYRAAMEVQWDESLGTRHSPVPKSWSYVDWFGQILAAAKKEYGCGLQLTSETRWSGITPEIRESILKAFQHEA